MCKKINLVFTLVCISINLFAQKEMPLNNPNYDSQKYHFGFILGLSQNKLQINYSSKFTEQNNYQQILSKYEPGFNVGIIMDVKIQQNYNLRITPSFNFTDQKIYYVSNNQEITQPKNSGISNFELPIYLKYRSDRVNNGRAYILLGANIIFDMGGFEELAENRNIEFSKTNYSLDLGFGIDIYFEYFKFAPEIKYSYGLKNVLISQNNEYDNMINQLSTRSILISLTFE
tara:strand:+ start:1412 stop:2101 length:690 start_codon:yes stop_codon:yes gene_type:complete